MQNDVILGKQDLKNLIMECVFDCLSEWQPSFQFIRIDDRYVDKKEAAEIASVSTSTIDNWARAGEIRRYYFGSSVRFYLPELKTYLNGKINPLPF